VLALNNRRVVVVAAAALLVAVVAMAGSGLAWAHADNKKRDVAVPPDSASPASVVRSYLRALDARDCRTVVTLWDGATSSDCTDVKSVRDIEVHDPVSEPAANALETYVTAHFAINWRWLHVNPSLNGVIDWGYYLSRDTPQSPWRIDRGAAG
jgi:hypothetical protein